MLKDRRVVRAVAQEIGDAANGAWEDYQVGDAPYEVDLTGRMIGAIRDRLRNAKIAGITWHARTLKTGRGKGAEEAKHGADLLGVLDIQLESYQTKKGFLAQAKRAEPSVKFADAKWTELTDQCKRMLRRTPDSFVFVYSISRGIRIFPASSVIGLNSHHIFDLYNRGLASFFESHIECFIGDPRLNSTDIQSLEALAELPVEHVLEIKARPE